MIETFFGSNTLSGSTAMLAALAIGLVFGFALERAGFGSSRRLAGIFYFRDMAVLKVMFTAVIVAMLGLMYVGGLGWIEADQMFFVLVAAGCFWGAEYIERRVAGTGVYWRSPFLKAFSVALVVLAVGLLAIHSGSPVADETAAYAPSETDLLAQIAEAEDHMEPEELADRIMASEAGLLLVDIRPAGEFEAFHIRGAVNIELAALPSALAPYRNQGLIILYSNGMTHPAQARDALARMGYTNVSWYDGGWSEWAARPDLPAEMAP